MKPRKFALLFALAIAVLAVGRWAQSQSDEDPLDPLKVAADTHHLAFENNYVRVLDVHLPPGKVEPRHRHPHGMTVYFTDWEAQVTPDGKPAERHPRKAGTFAWSDAVIHSVQNVGQTEGHVLRIELKF